MLCLLEFTFQMASSLITHSIFTIFNNPSGKKVKFFETIVSLVRRLLKQTQKPLNPIL